MAPGDVTPCCLVLVIDEDGSDVEWWLAGGGRGEIHGKVRDNTNSFFTDLTRIQPGMDPSLHFRCIYYLIATEAPEDKPESVFQNCILSRVRHEANNIRFR